MPPDDRPALRQTLPIRIYRLGEEPSDDLAAVTSPEQRLAMVAVLSRRMWELTGRQAGAYSRAETPARVIRPA